MPDHKGPWIPVDAETNAELWSRPDIEVDIGGSLTNVLAAIAMLGKRTPGEIMRLLSVRGTAEDPGSAMIAGHLRAMGVVDTSVEARGYEIPASIIWSRGPGHGREVRTRWPGSLEPHLTEDRIQEAVDGASRVIVGSVKSAEVVGRTFRQVGKGACLAYSPSGIELDEPYSSEVKGHMSGRRPRVMAVNDDELPRFMGMEILDSRGEIDIKQAIQVALAANEHAEIVIATMGRGGVIVAHDGLWWHRPETKMPQEEVVNPIGAGDRTYALFVIALSQGMSIGRALKFAIKGAEPVLRSGNAQGDLYDKFPYPIPIRGRLTTVPTPNGSSPSAALNREGFQPSAAQELRP